MTNRNKTYLTNSIGFRLILIKSYSIQNFYTKYRLLLPITLLLCKKSNVYSFYFLRQLIKSKVIKYGYKDSLEVVNRTIKYCPRWKAR